jgi:hypothetical protein
MKIQKDSKRRKKRSTISLTLNKEAPSPTNISESLEPLGVFFRW